MLVSRVAVHILEDPADLLQFSLGLLREVIVLND